MIADARFIPHGSRLLCGICIVGAGAAGLTLALGLLETGVDVIVLEAGGENLEESIQTLYDGAVSGAAHPPPKMYRQRRLGGSTAVWGGRCVPFDAQDFEVRPHVPLSGWPFGLEELAPFYRAAHDVLELGAFEYNARDALAADALIADFNDEHVTAERVERFSPPTNMWKRYGRTLKRSSKIKILKYAACARVVAEETGRHVENLNCISSDGSIFTIEANSYVIAVGGLETVRVLGHSGLGDHSGLLGRGYMCHIETRIGKLQLTPSDRKVIYGFEHTLDGVYARRRFSLTRQRQNDLSVLNATIRLHHPLISDPSHGRSVLSAIFLARKFVIPEYARKFGDIDLPEHQRKFSIAEHDKAWSAHGYTVNMLHVRNVCFGLSELFSFGGDWIVKRHLRHRRIPYVALPAVTGAYALDLHAEQAPNLDSRVMLDDVLDRNGIPKLRIDWRMTDLDYQTVSTTLQEFNRAVLESGCGAVCFDEADLDAEVRARSLPVGGHHIGTARIARDPKLGVVDADCRVHHMDNLYVAGSATFPTSSQANPTLTIVAMALRLARHLKQKAA
jgi:choline dehydrogenase-like flavoprotein